MPVGRFTIDGSRSILRCDVAERQTAEFRFDIDVAAAVEAVDLRGSAADGHFRDARQRHQSAATRHAHLFDRREIAPRLERQLHADVDLAVGQIQFGQRGVVVAGGRDVHGFADAAAVTPSSAARAKSGVIRISGRSRLAVDVTLPRPGMARRSRATSCAARCSLSESSPDRTSCSFSPGPPALIGEARTRNVEQLLSQFVFDRRLRAHAFAARYEVDRQCRFAQVGRSRAAAASAHAHAAANCADRGEHLSNFGDRPRDRDDLVDGTVGFVERAAWRDFERQLRLRPIARRHETGRQQRDERQ